jgi:hypothetical protein
MIQNSGHADSKILLNSVISTPGTKFMSLDISNFYLMTPMEDYEYIRMDLRDFPDDVITIQIERNCKGWKSVC